MLGKDHSCIKYGIYFMQLKKISTVMEQGRVRGGKDLSIGDEGAPAEYLSNL